MNKEFFVNSVREYLSHEQTYSVMDYYLLQNECIFSTVPRKAFLAGAYSVVAASCQLEDAKLLTPSSDCVCWSGMPWDSNS